MAGNQSSKEIKVKKSIRQSILFWMILVMTLGAVFSGPDKISSAQAIEQPWAQPINLSNSSASTQPKMAVDSYGTIHVIWLDQYNGYEYTSSRNGTQWTQTVPAEFPFTQYDSSPLLLADGKGYIHAFWTDSHNVLHYSRVLAANFSNAQSWEKTIELAESAIVFDVVVDAGNTLHVSYIRGISNSIFPAGVYYRRSIDGGITWADSALLYSSQYFRSVTPDTTNVKIASANTSQGEMVYVAWDNQSLKQIYLIKSSNMGASWGDPEKVGGNYKDSAGYGTPYNIEVMAYADDVLLLWKTGTPETPGSRCTQYSQFSSDHGANWSESIAIFNNTWQCPQKNKFLAFKNGFFLLSSIYQNQLYLLAWDGKKWSNPRLQNDLAIFTNPETAQTVNLGCIEVSWTGDDRLLGVGCDTGSGGDIWFSSRSLGVVDNWFTAESWTSPISLLSGSYIIASPWLIADQQGKLHVFWAEPDLINNANGGINYSFWDGDQWLQPIKIINSTDGTALNLQAVYDLRNDLIWVLWLDEQDGLIHFSFVDTNDAINPVDWSISQALPTGKELIGSFMMAVSEDTGVFSLIYAVPINETRGIFLLQSSDRGKTWSAPKKIFDAAAAQWEMVNSPRLLTSANGQLYALWSRYIPGIDRAEEIYFSSSDSNGMTWSDPQKIVEKSKITWSSLNSIPGENLIITWQEFQSGQYVTKYRYSSDKGITWHGSSQLSNLRDPNGLLTISQDSKQKAYLFRIVHDNPFNQLLEQWDWQNGEWIYKDYLVINHSPAAEAKSLTSSFSPSGLLAIIYGSWKNAGSLNPVYSIDFASRVVEAGAYTDQQIPLTTTTPAVTSTSTKILTKTVIASKTVISGNQPAQPTQVTVNSPKENNIPSTILIGIAILMLASAIVIGILYIKHKF